METVTAGNQHSSEPLLLSEPQFPDLGSVDEVAVAPGALLPWVPARWTTPAGSSVLLTIYPRTWRNPGPVTLIACDRW